MGCGGLCGCWALKSVELNNTNVIARVWAFGITPIYNTDSALLSQA
jgi:hypothetical protein